MVCARREMDVLYFVGLSGCVRVCTCSIKLYRATRMGKPSRIHSTAMPTASPSLHHPMPVSDQSIVIGFALNLPAQSFQHFCAAQEVLDRPVAD